MKILLYSDNPLMQSGYGKITGFVARHLRSQGHEVVILGSDPRQLPFAPPPLEFEGCKVYPVQEYGNAEHIRYILREEKPDIIWANSDPHFFSHMFKMDNEIRRQCPIVFYHLWDDGPFPKYNIPYYSSCDRIIAGSLFTFDLLMQSGLVDTTRIDYAPIGFDSNTWRPLSNEERQAFRTEINNSTNNKYANVKFVVGFIGRNAPRKQLLSIMDTFVRWQQGKPDALLFVHSPGSDFGGQFEYTMKTLYAGSNILFSQADPHQQGDDLINRFYNYFDVVVNRSEAEGFGMPIAEAMLAGTPCISINTSGPSGLITPENGWLLEADVKTLEGSPVTPYIYNRFVTDEKFMAALDEAYYHPEIRAQKAEHCRQYIMGNYSMKQFVESVEQSLIKAKAEWIQYPEYTVLTFPYAELNKEEVVNVQ